MGQGEIRLENGPSLVCVRLALPGCAIVQEHASCEEEPKCGDDNLGRGIGSTAGSGIVEDIFDLVEETFDRLIGIVGGIYSDVVVLGVSF